MSLKFGFSAQKKTTLPARKPQPVKSASAFGQDDSDDETSKPSLTDQNLGTKPSKKANLPISQYGDLSAQRQHKKNADKALDVDPSIYDYDAAYDAMQARAEAKKAADREKAEQGKAKYMENLLAAAEVRKKDQLRAQEKVLQRQRETEGEEFTDKEKFVTGAYKRQQEELKILEEEEKKKEEEESEKKKKMGNQVFFRNLINEQDRKHMDDVAITEAIQKGGAPKVEPEQTKKTDTQIAKELNAKGANIVLTDDGEIADKRQLLSAGLNVVAKPKPKVTPSSRNSQLQNPGPSQFGKGFNQKASRERQSRMVEAQAEQLLKRQVDEEDEEEKEKERAAKSRKTEGDVSSARERYLARKKAAEAAASKDSTS